ncbi:MAG TPA: serine/threonine-protein kinase, partial [Solirubrobacterales bacterium]|nr:serine/threonine-protein kinase [Solirubrobacterales bacterium]
MPETKPAPEPPAPRGPRSFGRYEVVEEIGNGAMGRVYRGFDPLVRRSVAIKTVRSEHLATGSADEYLRRFRREAQAAGRLSHPHIVSIYDVGEDYFVMEFLEGTSLEALLRQRVKLEVAEALRLLAPVADALDYAHKAGIVHRDIKPGNIMVLAEGRPKLMDFGVAHLDASVMTRAGEILGSPSYMAPEQIAGGEEVSARSDLFSLAVVAYEAVTGRKPFEGTSLTNIIYRVVHEDAPPP